MARTPTERERWPEGAWRKIESRELAEAVRVACLDAALRAYEDAGVQGLCGNGRHEVAMAAIRALDVNRVLAEFTAGSHGSPRSGTGAGSSDGEMT